MTTARESLSGGGRSSGVTQAILDVCREVEDSRALRTELRARLHRSVPFDAYCVNTCDPLSLVVTSSVGDGLSPRDALRLFSIESAGQDVNLLADLATKRTGPAVLSRTTLGSVHRSRRMREIFLPLGLHDELRAPLFAGDRCWGYLHLFRSRATFSELDAARVADVIPEIGRGLRRTMVVTGSSRTSTVLGPGLVVVGPDGSARVAAGGADRAIRSLDLDGHQPVPHGVYAVAERARRAQTGDAIGTVRSAAGEWISLHGIAYGSRPAAIVDAASAAQVAPLVLLGCCLTDRERQVAALLVRGSSNSEIAHALSIRVFTVKDHVKRVLSKTRTGGRAALVALVSGAPFGRLARTERDP